MGLQLTTNLSRRLLAYGLVVLFVTGCGRIGFDPVGSRDDASTASRDGSTSSGGGGTPADAGVPADAAMGMQGSFQCTQGTGCACAENRNCQIDCPGGGCVIECRANSNCNVNCPDGDCSLYCGTGANCDQLCSPSTSCYSTCWGANECTMTCPNDSCTTATYCGVPADNLDMICDLMCILGGDCYPEFNQ